MRDYQYTISANSQDPKTVLGNFIKVKSASAELRIIAENADGQPIADLKMTAGSSIKLSEQYVRVRIENQAGATAQAVLVLGMGDYNDNELVGTVAISGGTTITTSSATVTGVAAVILPSDSTRRSVIIQNLDPLNPIYIGGAGTTPANGLIIPAAGNATIDKSALAEFVAVSDGQDVDIRILQELN